MSQWGTQWGTLRGVQGIHKKLRGSKGVYMGTIVSIRTNMSIPQRLLIHRGGDPDGQSGRQISRWTIVYKIYIIDCLFAKWPCFIFEE